jgi:hypothetical protein
MNEELKRAAALIKQGEKGQASTILRGVLRSDPQNVEAWWMLSYTFDSTDKATQALERALSLDPAHAASNKRIAKLRGDEPRPAPTPVVQVAAPARRKPKNDATVGADYWDKLDNPPKPKGGMARDVGGALLGNPWVLRIIVMVVLVAGGSVWAVFQNIQVRDANGHTPTDVVRAFEEAYWVEDAATMRSLVCPGYESYFNEVWSGTYTYAWGYNPVSDVDLSRMRTRQIRFAGDEATVAFYGTVSWLVDGSPMSYSYDEEADAQGGDVWIGHHVRMIDGVWMICDGPDTVYY